MKEFSRRLRRFAADPAVTLDTLEIEEASVHAEAKSLLKKVAALRDIIDQLDTEQFYGEEELWETLSELVDTIKTKLKEADKRSVG